METDGKGIDLTNFDFRSGTFLAEKPKSTKKRKQPNQVDIYGKDLVGISMAYPSAPARQSKKISKEPVTVVSKDTPIVEEVLDYKGAHDRKDNGIVSPRQIFWEKRLQSINCCTSNRVEDFDIFSNTNGEFCSLLHSIVKTLQMERDLASAKSPTGTTACLQKNGKSPSRTLIKITKADILRQEREVIKARKKLAKAIAEYEAVKSL